MVIELKVALLRMLFVARFDAPLGKTRFSAPVPEGATPPAQLAPTPQLAFCAPVQVNVWAKVGATIHSEPRATSKAEAIGFIPSKAPRKRHTDPDVLPSPLADETYRFAA